MRILAVEDELTTFRGGSERSYFDVLTGLQSEGHEVNLLYAKGGNLTEPYLAAGIKLFERPHFLLLRKGSKWNDLRSIWKTVSFLKKNLQPDLVYLNFAEAIPLGALIHWRLGIPVVCHIRIGYFGLSRQILWCSRAIGNFIVINKKFLPVFERAFRAAGRVHVVYNGLTIPATLPDRPIRTSGEPLRIVYLGRIAKDKGTIELVQAFAKAIKNGVKATLQITGSYVASYLGDFQKELAEAVEASGVSDLISIDGPAPDPVNYISKYDLFIFPSTWDEGFGRTVPESILGGTPVLARDVGMIREIMSGNENFVFENDDRLVEKIVQFYKGDLRFDMVTSRKHIVTDFNKTRMISEVNKILSDAVNRTP